MTHLDLFAGIGGFSLAARWLGIETIGFSEVDPYCCKVLAKNFPGVKNYGDIKTLDGRTIAADLITGGFPCQPWSLAGKRQGEADARHLWPEMARIISEVQPTYVVAENVPGIIGLALERVCLDLESLGYEVAPVVIPACAVDAPHRRDRVWILAYAQSYGLEKSAWQNGEQNGRSSVSSGLEFARNGSDASNPARPRSGRLPIQPGRPQQAGADVDGCGEVMADAQCQRNANDQQRATDSETRAVQGNGPEWERLWFDARQCANDERGEGPTFALLGRGDDGLPTELDHLRRGWASGSWQDGIPPTATGVKHRVDRLRALGNAIVPQVAYEILKAMLEVVP